MLTYRWRKRKGESEGDEIGVGEPNGKLCYWWTDLKGNSHKDVLHYATVQTKPNHLPVGSRTLQCFVSSLRLLIWNFVETKLAFQLLEADKIKYYPSTWVDGIDSTILLYIEDLVTKLGTIVCRTYKFLALFRDWLMNCWCMAVRAWLKRGEGEESENEIWFMK